MPNLEVFRHVIDAYRLHGNEMYQRAEKASDESPEYLDDGSFEVFAQYLRFVEMQPGLFPNCCTQDRYQARQKLATDKTTTCISVALPHGNKVSGFLQLCFELPCEDQLYAAHTPTRLLGMRN